MQFMFNLYIQNGNEHVQSIQHIESKKKSIFLYKKHRKKYYSEEVGQGAD